MINQNAANDTAVVWKVYAARDYDNKNPRLENFVEINTPDHVPTVPMDNAYTNIQLSKNYFANSNYPIVTGVVQASHYFKLPLMKGCRCPIYFKKGTPFLLFTPTAKMEEGYLIYIE